jgi:hypothetical protein
VAGARRRGQGWWCGCWRWRRRGRTKGQKRLKCWYGGPFGRRRWSVCDRPCLARADEAEAGARGAAAATRGRRRRESAGVAMVAARRKAPPTARRRARPERRRSGAAIMVSDIDRGFVRCRGGFVSIFVYFFSFVAPHKAAASGERERASCCGRVRLVEKEGDDRREPTCRALCPGVCEGGVLSEGGRDCFGDGARPAAWSRPLGRAATSTSALFFSFHITRRGSLDFEYYVNNTRVCDNN